MPILNAYALPHPPLAVPDVGKGRESEIQDTLTALDAVAREIAGLTPETVIFITPHNAVYLDYFHISPGYSAKGDLSRFGAGDVRFEVEYDAELAEEIARKALRSGLSAGTDGERDAALDHGVTVPMWFINRRYTQYKAVRVSPSGLSPAEHYCFGAQIAEAVGKRRAVLIASGDLSHKLSAGAPYGFAPEGAEFDEMICQAFASGDLRSLLDMPGRLRERAAECGYNGFAMLAGCFDRLNVKARLLSYEGPFGVGYAVASFTPGEPEEDAYRLLARRSLEYTVKHGGTLPVPDGLPGGMLDNRAGTFVSLHSNGRLRGCVGTIAPTTGSVALEIIQNAVSAGLRDNRFRPVTASELPHLTYKVDVLSAPELISGPEELDVKRYGVIVSSGQRRGLLLPNLDGVDTVSRQVSIAKQKAGISPAEACTLERFEVVRYT
jgi:AmmeMemoRadiSam system protein A/AmmeMemoRadiSam system protein B